MEKLMKEILCRRPVCLISVLGEACLPLSPLTGTNKEQRAQEWQETAQRNPPVKHALTVEDV